MRAVVKSRQIIDAFIEQIGLFSVPVFQGLDGGYVAQCFLGDVLVVDLDITFNGIGQVLG